MNTNVKVGIAAAIVAALVALIVLDQKTSPKDDTAVRPGSGSEAITVVGSGADAPAERLSPADADKLYERARKEFAPAKAEKSAIKGSEEKNEKKIIPSATGEEYVIKEGDTFETIAKTKYGSGSFAGLIADANPGVKATALRVGKHLVLPPKAEKKAEEPAADAAAATEAPAAEAEAEKSEA